MILKLFEATWWFRTLLATPSQTFTFPRKKRRIRGEKGNRPVHHRWRKERHERFAVHSAVLGHGNGTVFCVKASTSDFVVNHRDSRAGERTTSIGSSRFCGAASSYVRNAVTHPFQRMPVTYRTQEDDEEGSWAAARTPLVRFADESGDKFGGTKCSRESNCELDIVDDLWDNLECLTLDSMLQVQRVDTHAWKCRLTSWSPTLYVLRCQPR